MLELAGPFEIDAGRQIDAGGDGAFRLLDELRAVPATDVESNVIAQQAILALDRGRTLDDAHVGNVRQTHLLSRRAEHGDRQITGCLFIAPPVAPVTDAHRMAFAAL